MGATTLTNLPRYRYFLQIKESEKAQYILISESTDDFECTEEREDVSGDNFAASSSSVSSLAPELLSGKEAGRSTLKRRTVEAQQ